MKTIITKAAMLCAAVLASCLNISSVAVGQTPPANQPTGLADQSLADLFQNWGLTSPARSLPQAAIANYTPPTPEQQAKAEQAARLGGAAFLSLQSGRYAEAEAEARRALSVKPGDIASEVLARALDGQGKEVEALQAYRALTVDGREGPTGQTRVLLPYALLLLKSGQWAQAVSAYNATLSSLGDKDLTDLGRQDLMQATSHFSPNAPEPAALATAIHIARGLTYNGECDFDHGPQNTEALAEYNEALRLAPDSALANYYYGRGWQKLSPAERSKIGGVQQARLSLQKAILLGKGDLKRAAQKALKDLNKPVPKPA